MTDHLMQPPTELLGDLAKDAGYPIVPDWLREAIHNAYTAGADAQLEACVEWLIESMNPRWAVALRAAMRPKPPSLKDRSLALISRCTDPGSDHLDGEAIAFIRRALEALPK